MQWEYKAGEFLNYDGSSVVFVKDYTKIKDSITGKEFQGLWLITENGHDFKTTDIRRLESSFLLDKKNPNYIKSETGFVYYVQAQDSNYFKIGMTADPLSRLEQLMKCCPFYLEIIGLVYSPYTSFVERDCQYKLWSLHKRGEWFELNPEKETPSINSVLFRPDAGYFYKRLICDSIRKIIINSEGVLTYKSLPRVRDFVQKTFVREVYINTIYWKPVSKESKFEYIRRCEKDVIPSIFSFWEKVSSIKSIPLD